MRAAVLAELGAPLVVEELALRPAAEHELIVRTEATAFCITDCLVTRGELGFPQPPTILGHSAVGVVEEVGPGVTRAKAGDRVVMPASPECGQCYWCVRGRPDQCAQLLVPARHVADRADGTPVTAEVGGVGSYAEYMNLREIAVFPVESDLEAELLSVVGCGVTSGLGAVFNAAQVQPGSSVAIVGAGHLGLWMVQGARAAGAAQIVVVEPRAHRRLLAGELGATDLVDPAEGDPVEQVRELTGGRGADYGLEAAGPPEAMAQAFAMTREAGTVVFTGVTDMTSEVSFPAVMIALQGRTIRSSQNGMCSMMRDIPLMVAMLESGVVDARPIINARYSLDQINDAAQAADSRAHLTGVLVF